jgi:hypothetical protein
MINLCIPTLNQYQLMIELMVSADKGNVPPDKFYVFDNGGKLEPVDKRVTIYKAPCNLGVAKSWNWFINNVPDIRIISNDDLVFGPETIANMSNAILDGAEFVGLDNISGLNLFSLFAITDKCVEKVGLFDEDISPNYAYFEDNDYHRRMNLLGVKTTYVKGDVIHVGSATLKSYTPEELEQHHQKFRRAKANYILKWGGEPGKETKTNV